MAKFSQNNFQCSSTNHEIREIYVTLNIPSIYSTLFLKKQYPLRSHHLLPPLNTLVIQLYYGNGEFVILDLITFVVQYFTVLLAYIYYVMCQHIPYLCKGGCH